MRALCSLGRWGARSRADLSRRRRCSRARRRVSVLVLCRGLCSRHTRPRPARLRPGGLSQLRDDARPGAPSRLAARPRRGRRHVGPRAAGAAGAPGRCAQRRRARRAQRALALVVGRGGLAAGVPAGGVHVGAPLDRAHQRGVAGQDEQGEEGVAELPGGGSALAADHFEVARRRGAEHLSAPRASRAFPGGH